MNQQATTMRLDVYVKRLVNEIENDVSRQTPYSQMQAQRLLNALEVLDSYTYAEIVRQGRFVIDSVEYMVSNDGYVLV